MAIKIIIDDDNSSSGGYKKKYNNNNNYKTKYKRGKYKKKQKPSATFGMEKMMRQIKNV